MERLPVFAAVASEVVASLFEVYNALQKCIQNTLHKVCIRFLSLYEARQFSKALFQLFLSSINTCS